MRYTGPKARLCRREGVNLFSSAKYQKIMEKNPGIPGMHGQKRQGKISDYGKQLREKQKAKRMYGLSESQFKKYVQVAIGSRMVTGDALFQQLETRMDNVIYRAGMALTRMQSRQFVSHGIFMLNGRRVDIPSIQVSVGDVIEVRESRKGIDLFKQIAEALEDYNVPSWLKVDPKKMTIEITALPGVEHFETLIEPRPIIEFYSR